MMEMFGPLTVTVLTQLHAFVTAPGAIHQRRMDFTVCQLHLNKPDSKPDKEEGDEALLCQ